MKHGIEYLPFCLEKLCLGSLGDAAVIVVAVVAAGAGAAAAAGGREWRHPRRTTSPLSLAAVLAP